MAEPFSRYLNSVAKLDSYLRNLLKLNKELSDANHKLRSDRGTFEAREQARERTIKDLEEKLNVIPIVVQEGESLHIRTEAV